jgi:hypothetical protein
MLGGRCVGFRDSAEQRKFPRISRVKIRMFTLRPELLALRGPQYISRFPETTGCFSSREPVWYR